MSLVFQLMLTWIASAWRPVIGPSDTLMVRRRVGLLDLDFNLHMNHARFLGVLEQAMLESLQRSGFLRTMLSLKTVPMIGGAMISYRRELRPWQRYRIHLKYLGAEPRWHVFGFRFINDHDQVVAWGFVKGAAIRWRRSRGSESRVLNTAALWAAHTQRVPGWPTMPELPPAVLDWLALERDAHPSHDATHTAQGVRP